MASGILVVPLEKLLMKVADDGMKYPKATPISMAKNIHNVKKRSKKPKRFLETAGLQLLLDMD